MPLKSKTLANIDVTNYLRLVGEYKELQDNDPVTAFGLMIRASAEKEYFDSLVADAVKEVIDAERHAKAVNAQVSVELSPKPTEGARKAEYDERVVAAWQAYAQARCIKDKMAAHASMLERIYFDTKMIYEKQSNKKAKIV